MEAADLLAPWDHSGHPVPPILIPPSRALSSPPVYLKVFNPYSPEDPKLYHYSRGAVTLIRVLFPAKCTMNDRLDNIHTRVWGPGF